MKKTWKGFTLVELLVVITILAIISVIAYQNFGGAVDKAVSGRKINDISTIETALQQFKVDNNFYPPADTYSGTTNLWGYDNTQIADASNQIVVVYNGEEIQSINTTDSIGGGRIYGIGTWAVAPTQRQIGAKGTISRESLGKKYLSKDLYDPEIGDIKVNDIGGGLQGKMIDLGIGRYVYATLKKNTGVGNWSSNYNGVNYNIAFTIKKDGSDKYITKIVGDYDAESCYDDSALCPASLIGLTDGSEQTAGSDQVNYGIPYAVTDFAQ
ncbi:prepilin-type N-terminal cleavage/methylation domain-containing protein [Candidatus Gracilibacteria bacterium]|nr:prepilin-type N-terminal cleavage/methylation domain-containing protein [Candidatus Gracilibacteria bacterium]NUJ99449.1 prepilin-type N-terminal cleavage/methylation domain-containing protein [Candidatus Gracilibacteria bacterium]